MQTSSSDRATLYLVDPVQNDFQVYTKEGASGLRLPLDLGIPGSVLKTAKVLNVPDAYREKQFDPSEDKKTGYVTKTLLAFPVPDAEGNIVAIVEAVNKKAGKFEKLDEEILEIMRVQAGSALANAVLHSKLAHSKDRLDAMVDIEIMINKSLQVNNILSTISGNAHSLIGGDKCVMYSVDRSASEMVTGEGLRFPLDKGVPGYVASKGEIINMIDPYNDPRFDPSQDQKNNYKTNSMLVVPLYGAPVENGQGSVVAVVQILNKLVGKFDDDDIAFMANFAAVLGPIVEQSQLFERMKQQ